MCGCRCRVGFSTSLRRLATIVLLVTTGAIADRLAIADEPPFRQRYDRLDASADATRLGDIERLGNLNNQLDLNNRMRAQGWMGSYYRGVFEPWPMVPGYIWGYPILSPIRQSVGQRQYQAGANRWISEPVYADQITAPPIAETGVMRIAPMASHKTTLRG